MATTAKAKRLNRHIARLGSLHFFTSWRITKNRRRQKEKCSEKMRTLAVVSLAVIATISAGLEYNEGQGSFPVVSVVTLEDQDANDGAPTQPPRPLWDGK